MAAAVLTGCTSPFPLDDRLPYSTIEQIQLQTPAAPVTFDIDQATRTFIIEQRPSSPLGFAIKRRFEVGKTLSAYLKQAEAAMKRDAAAPARAVKVHLASGEVNYTYSWLAFFSFRVIPDWIDLSLRIESDDGSGPRELVFEQKIDRDVGDLVFENQPDRIVNLALEAIALDYLKKVLENGQ